MSSRSLGTLTLDLVAKIGGFTQSMNQAAQVVDKRMKSMQDSADKAKKALSSVFALTIGGLTVKGLMDMADQYGQMASRIKMATASSDEYNQVQKRLLQTANITFRPLQEAQELYIRTADSIKSLGYNTNQALDITDSFSYLLVTNAASADRAGSAISALSKSIQTGKVSSQEWQSILAATPTIVDSIALSSGKTTEQIRNLGIQGKLSLNDLLEGLRKNVEANKQLAEGMDTAVNDSLVKFKNNLSTLIGEQNSAYGLTTKLAQGISLLGDNLNLLAAGAFVALAGKVGAMSASLALSTVEMAKNTLASIQNAIAKRNEAIALVTTTQALLSNIAAEKAFAITLQQSLNAQLRLAETEVARNAIRQQMKVNAVQLVTITNAETAATTRLAAAQTAAAGIGRTLLGVLGGPVGIGLTVASVAAGWLLFKDNTDAANEALNKIKGSIEQVTDELNKMSKSQLDNTYNQIIKKIDEVKKKQQELANSATASFRSSSQTYDIANEFFIDNKNIKEAVTYFEDLTRQGKSFSEAATEIKDKFSDVIPKDTLDRLIAAASEFDDLGDELKDLNGKAGLTQTKINDVSGATKVLKDELAGLGQSMTDALTPEQTKGIEKLLDNINDRILQLKDSTGMLSLQKSLGDLKIPEGSDQWNQVVSAQKELIALQAKSSQSKVSVKSDNDLAKNYQNQVIQLNQQLDLFNETSQAAKMRYELANGELKTLSDTQKQLLINKSIELDQLNARKEFDSLMKELRTDEEKARDTLSERLKLLKEANVQGQEYANAMARINKASISEAPKFGGIDASVGGASGELIKVAETQKELDKWRAKELEQQQKYLDEKLIAEEDYANNVIEINKRTAKSQEQLNSAWQIATIGTFSSVTGDVADMFKEMAGESSAAYKIMFAASKAAAIAQAIISTEVAANKALEMGTILGIPAATAVRALGYASVGMIAATSIAGMAHSGIDNIPKEGTWLLDKGERVLSPRQNSDLTSFLQRASNSSTYNNTSLAPQVSIVVNQDGTGSVVSTEGYENFGRQSFEAIKQITLDTIMKEKRKGGQLDPNNRRNG